MHDLTEDEKRYEKYIGTAMELLTTGSEVSPSVRALVERCGGSMTTANKAMRVFWGYVGRRLSYDQQYPDGMPPEVIKLTEKLMAVARTSAAKELEDDRVKIEKTAQEQEASRKVLEQSVESLSEALEQEKEVKDSLREQLNAAKEQLVNANKENEGLRQDMTSLSSQLAVLEKERESLTSRLTACDEERHNLRAEIHVKDERIISVERTNQTLTERVAYCTGKEEESRQELDQCRTKIRSLEDRNLRFQEALGVKSTEMARAEAEVTETRRYNSKLEADLERSLKRTEHQERQLSGLDSELVILRPLTTRVDELDGQISDLRGERDQLLRLLGRQSLVRRTGKKDADAD